MNTESVDCRKVRFGEMTQAGDFCIDHDTCYIWLPGMTGPDAINISTKEYVANSRVWEWNGDNEKPTLQPSIHAEGQWHGWLKAGRLVSC